MFVRDRMSSPAITVTPDTVCQDAMLLMDGHQISRLPVLAQDGMLVGIITRSDLPCTLLSPAVPLSTFEQRYLLRNLEIREVMNEAVVSVGSCHDTVSGGRGLIVKVQDASRDQLVDPLEALGDHVVDAREVPNSSGG